MFGARALTGEADADPELVARGAQYAFFLNTNPTLLVDKTGIIPVGASQN